MAATVGISPAVDDEIRTLVQTKRIRVTEFFQDYDKLRSGFVTGKFRFHFLPCISHLLVYYIINTSCSLNTNQVLLPIVSA